MQFNLFDSIKSHVDNFADNLYTSVPAIVESYDPERASISCYPAIYKKDKDGVEVKHELLEEVPVHFISTSKLSITHPLEKGDQVMLFFAQCDTEDWLESESDFTPPKTLRKHNINDAFAIPWMSKYGEGVVKNGTENDLHIQFGSSFITIKSDGSIEIIEGNSASTISMESNGNVEIFAAANLNLSSVGTTTVSGGTVVVQK